MNGGSGSYAYHLGPQFAEVIEVGAVHAAKVDAGGLNLTLTSYLAGLRFFNRRPHARVVPYGQVLLGAVRATGGLAPANSGGTPSSTVFGSTLGGGVEFNIPEPEISSTHRLRTKTSRGEAPISENGDIQ